MKLFYTLLLLLVGLLTSSPSVAQGSLAALDTKNGFKDAKFGMPLSAFKGMVLQKNHNPFSTSSTKICRRPTYENKVGNIKLDYVEYEFTDDVLYVIVFTVKGMANCKNVLKAIQSAYGPGEVWPTKMGMSWKGKEVYLNLLPMRDGEGVNEDEYYRFQMGRNSPIKNSTLSQNMANDL